MLQETRAQLAKTEDRLRSLREEKARAVKVANAAKAAAGQSDNDAAFVAAKQANDAVKSISGAIEDVHEEQVTLLRRIGDAEAGLSGLAFAGVNGWEDVARHLDLEGGGLRADVPLGALMRPMAAFNAPSSPGASSVSTVRAPMVRRPMDRRYVYPVFPRETLDNGVLAVVDFRQDVASGSVTGDVMRDPVSVGPKAELEVGITAGSEDVEQFAITIDDVPQVLFYAEQALQAFLQTEMQRVLDLAIDTHVLSQIEAADPPSGLSGPTLVEQVRNAVADARSLGAWPTVLALNPDDAAALDLHTATGSGEFTFATRNSGSASPLWSLQIVESPSVADPMLIDPGIVGALYGGAGTLTIDPYTGLKTNTVRLRMEIEALFHVRATAGAYVIA